MTDVNASRPSIIDRGLSSFGAAWFAAFGLTLILSMAVAVMARGALYELMDRMLLVSLAGLGILWLGAVVIALFSPTASLLEKLLFVLVSASLLLPLLWGPILGVVTTAWLIGATVEYSQVYAQFRIHVAQLLFPVASRMFQVNLLDVIWNIFQVVATVIGFIAAVTQLWPMFTSRLGRTTPSLEG